MIESRTWIKLEEVSLLTSKKHVLGIGDMVNCSYFEFEKSKDLNNIDSKSFKEKLDDIRELIAILYHFEETDISSEFSSKFTITNLKDFQKDVLPNLKQYNPIFYNELLRKPTVKPADFIIAELDKVALLQ